MINKRAIVFLANVAVTVLIFKLTGFNLECLFTNISNLLTFFLISIISYKILKKLLLSGRVNPVNKSVLVTGCDSGFGHLFVQRLDAKGFHVFASCLFPNGQGAEALKKTCSKRLKIFELDVSKDESVQSAVSFVKHNLGDTKLWAIVNNAGIQKGFSVEFSILDDYKDTYNVNVLGPVRMTRAFLPLLREHKGRIVNTTSIYGRFLTPYVTPYVMSKWAAVAFNGCLRQEMALWGIPVISIEPEVFETSILSKEVFEKKWHSTLMDMDSGVKSEYGDEFVEILKKSIHLFRKTFCHNLDVVVDDMVSAVELKYPDHTYRPRRNFFVRFITFCYLAFPETLQDLITRCLSYAVGIPLNLRTSKKRS